jgi:YVTN family beta-propeller protein
LRYVGTVPLILLLACGNPSGLPPEPGPGPTPSVLTAELRGWSPPDRGPAGIRWTVDVSWTACPDTDFVAYALYRSVDPDIQSSSGICLASVSDAGDTTFTDWSGLWDETYYYAVSTFSEAGRSWSNADTVAVGPRSAYGGPDTFFTRVAVGGGPTGVCSAGYAGESFVSCSSADRIWVLGPASVYFTVQDVIEVGASPLDICSDGPRAFVSCSGDDEVCVIDAFSHSVVGNVTVGSHPAGLCYDPVRDLVLVACFDSDEVWVIDAGSSTVVGSIPVGNGPWDVCSSGSRAYAANLGDGSVSVMDLMSMSVVAAIDIGPDTRNVCALADGSEVWVSDFSGNSIYAIDTGTLSVEKQFDTDVGPVEVYSLENGQMVYVSCFQGGWMDMIDPVTGALIYMLGEVKRPRGMCCTPDGDHLLVCDNAANMVVAFQYDPWP